MATHIWPHEYRVDSLKAGEPERITLVGYVVSDRESITPEAKIRLVYGDDWSDGQKWENAEERPVELRPCPSRDETSRAWRFETPVKVGWVFVELVAFQGAEELAKWGGFVGPYLNGTSVVTDSLKAPRLILALESTHVPKSERPAAPPPPPPAPGVPSPPPLSEAELHAFLRHVWNRLERGLEGAWFGVDGMESIDRLQGPPPVRLEEEWAQAVTEKLLGLPYAGPDLAYGITEEYEEGGQTKKRTVAGPLFKKMLDEDDPAYPIVAACQQCTTMIALSRGNDVLQTSSEGLSAGIGACDTVKGPGSRVLRYPDFAAAPSKIIVADQILTTPPHNKPPGDAPLGPGDFLVFNASQSGADQSLAAHPHIVSVVRVATTEKRAWVQLLEVGGTHFLANLVDPEKTGRTVPVSKTDSIEREHGVRRGYAGSNHYDGLADSNWIEIIGHYYQSEADRAPCRGIGIFPKSAADLRRGIDRTRRARPLGMARLILVKGTDYKAWEADPVVFATPMLRMYTDQDKGALNFPPALYLWSLRNHPLASDYTAMWVVYVPRGEFAEYLMEGRDQRLDDYDGGWKTDKDLQFCFELASDKDGYVYFFSTLESRGPQPPARAGRGAVRILKVAPKDAYAKGLDAQQVLAAYEYFRGDWA